MAVNSLSNNALLQYLQSSGGRGSTLDSLYASTSEPNATGAASTDSLEKLKALVAEYKEKKAQVDPNYTALKEASKKVKDNIGKLVSGGTDSIFEKAASSDNNDDVLKEVKAFVKNYNAMLGNLGDATDSRSIAQYEQIVNSSISKMADFTKIGISIGKDGTLSIDEKALDGASLDNLKRVFNGPASFAARVKVSISYVESNAAANEKVETTGVYGRQGAYSRYLAGSSSNYNTLN